MSKKESKIVLGTVQFGLNYGINNNAGVIDDVSLFDLLNCANQNGIFTLDTAYNYGQSEYRIGKYLSNTDNDFNIISKAPRGSNSINIKKSFEESLLKLNKNSLYGYLLHDFRDYINDKNIIETLIDLKETGLVNKIGFSVYYPKQLDILLEDDIDINLIQLPYNLADHRFEKYFATLKQKKVEIHARSVFLQGLFFMNADELRNKLKPFNKFKMKLDAISKSLGRTIQNIALNFVSQNKNIDKIVIGVDNKLQLKSNLDESNSKIEPNLLLNIKAELSKIYVPTELLIPSNWN